MNVERLALRNEETPHQLKRAKELLRDIEAQLNRIMERHPETRTWLEVEE